MAQALRHGPFQTASRVDNSKASDRECRFGGRRLAQASGAADAMALHVLAYNLTRVMNIVGRPALIAAIRAG